MAEKVINDELTSAVLDDGMMPVAINALGERSAEYNAEDLVGLPDETTVKGQAAKAKKAAGSSPAVSPAGPGAVPGIGG
jgi:hypothetical protein